MAAADVEAFLGNYFGELLAGNAAVFAGAGLSVPAGFVDWRDLLRPLSRELNLDIDLETDLVAFAQFHVNANFSRSQLHQAIVQQLASDAPPTENHRLLAQLPISTYWTTNFDTLLEDALRGTGKTVDVKWSVPQLATSRAGRDVTVFKMHGDIDRPDECVVTRDDFERYGRDRAPFITNLAGDLVSKTFLFLGFSFTDPNLEQVLSRVRLSFADNQRRHYAIFRRRTQLANESQASFEHHRARQEHFFTDLRHYNVKVLIVDDYREITEILQVLVNWFRRRTVLISGSVEDYAPWGHEHVAKFGQALGEALSAAGARVATGLGLGIGDAVFTGALRAVRKSRGSVDDSLVLRPFPQGGDTPAEVEAIWEGYRKELVSHAGTALFLFGNKSSAGHIVTADGVRKEYDVSLDQGVVAIPVGATGSVAADLARAALDNPEKFLPALSQEDVATVANLAAPTDNLLELVSPIVKLVGKLKGSGYGS